MIDRSAGPSGLYFHIPFCRRKCFYCDFFSGGARNADWKILRNSLLNELKLRIGEVLSEIRTVYIGGGTPSLMPADEFLDFCNGLNEILSESSKEDLNSLAEFTLEVNPEDVTPCKIEAWKSGGVNRISMGVQTLVDTELKTIGRTHDSERARIAAGMLRDAFQNLSLDVMFGLPGQNLNSLEYTLDGLLQLSPDHISAYSLMYEEGTPITVMSQQGRLQVVEEEMSLNMYRLITGKLSDVGFKHYEISNYAKDGFQSIHNSSYWEFLPYLGIGPSAHSYDGSCIRRSNPSDIRQFFDYYSDCGLDDKKPLTVSEQLSETEQLEEYIMLRLRTSEGLAIDEFEKFFGNEASSRLKDGASLIGEGLIDFSPERISLNNSSVMISDDIILRLVNSVV